MTTHESAPTIDLGHASTPGLTIPQIGFGVWEVPDAAVDAAFAQALDDGYRHIDTARIYGNEEGVGRVLAREDVDRDSVFVTTKVWNDDHTDVPAAFDASMQRLGIDVLDLYLIHWPAPQQDAYVDAWRAMLELQREGRVRSVGVCNFQVPHLQRLLDETGVLPSVNQIELSPYLQQRELRAFHAEQGIVTEAWSPLAVRAGLLDDPVVVDLAGEALGDAGATRAALARRARQRRADAVGDPRPHHGERRDLRLPPRRRRPRGTGRARPGHAHGTGPGHLRLT